jgi:hypothetical protein
MRPALLALLALTACATVGAPAPSAPAPAPAPVMAPASTAPAAHALVASIQRGPCFGRCPVYEARLYADGVVAWNGVRAVAVTGQATATVSPATVAEVRAALARAGFAQLQPRYDQPRVDDLPWVEVGDGARRVRRTTDVAPAALLTLEAELDRLLGTAGWISGAVLDR